MRRTIKKYKSLIVITDQGFISLANLLTSVMLARFLSISEFGQFILAYGIILFFFGIQLAYIISPLMTIAPKHENPSTYLASVLKIQLAFATIVAFID